MTNDKADITQRLRQTRANMIGTDDETHYWDCHEAADEIERLREQDATLTDNERLAICYAAESLYYLPWYQQKLRALLERTQQATEHARSAAVMRGDEP